MTNPLYQSRQAAKSFKKTYWVPPYQNYISSVGVSLVGTKDPSAPLAEHCDYCIAVGLHTPLPPGVSFPSHHDGFRVITHTAGIPMAY